MAGFENLGLLPRLGERGRSPRECGVDVEMTKMTQCRVIGLVVGSVLGAILTSYAFHVQGGTGQSFAFVGAIVGGFTGYTAMTRQLRLHYLGAAVGSIAALTLFQVPVCDGSHFGMPAIGAAAGAILGGIPESILERKQSAADQKCDTALLQSTNKAMDTKCSISRLDLR